MQGNAALGLEGEFHSTTSQVGGFKKVDSPMMQVDRLWGVNPPTMQMDGFLELGGGFTKDTNK